MLTYLRYALTTFCFAASVGCLALWSRSRTCSDQLTVASFVLPSKAFGFEVTEGKVLVAEIYQIPVRQGGSIWRLNLGLPSNRAIFTDHPGEFGRIHDNLLYFPLWYPALVFALAAVAAIRMRRFTLRSALVAMSVVAALLGMVVIL